MITQSRLCRHTVSLHTLIGTIAMMVLFDLTPAIASADSPASLATAPRSAKVSLADLDLSTPAGLHLAHERIRKVAEHLCHDREDPWSRYHAASYKACVRETVADALNQVQAPAIVAREE